MDQKRANAGNICSLGSTPQSIFEQSPTQSDALMSHIHCKTREDHDGDGMSRDAFDHPRGSGRGIDTADGEAIETDHRSAVATHIRLSAVGLLTDERKAMQKRIKRHISAVE